MPNLRVISDNAIDRASLAASSTATGYSVLSLKLPRKSDVWRAGGTTASIKAFWTAPETVQGIALPFCDLSPTASLRIRVTSEVSTTNLLASPNTFSAAAWTKTSMTVGAAVAGPDSTTSATTLTASAAAGTIAQSVTVAAGSNTSSIWVRRRTGTGAVAIRNAANTAWTNLAVSSSWQRFVASGTTGTTATLQLQLATSGDAIDVAFGQIESGAVATSYYAGVRPLGYMDDWQDFTNYGYRLACPAPAARLRGFTAAQAASAYAFGGGATARFWLDAPVNIYGLSVDIVDPDNLTGAIEAAYLVAGPYWESATNFDYGASAQLVDSSKSERNDAGDLITDAGTVSTRLSIPFSKLSPADRATLWDILRAGGTRYPSFISMFPGHTDLALERDHQVYGKMVQLPVMALPFFNLASATVEVESV
jgi:hypothetical protein